jgi:hypothetical protein
MDSDIAYFENQNTDTISIIKYKAGDYIPDDKLYEFYTKFYDKIHSTGRNFYLLEKSMSIVNKNNSRHIVGGRKGLQMVYVIRLYVYAYSPIDSPKDRSIICMFLETHTN